MLLKGEITVAKDTLNYWMNCNISYQDGKAYSEHELLEIVNHGKPARVMVLSEQEAKALISEEYGFEYNSIKIEDICWYEATDWNYFRFSVRGRQYEVKNYETLTIL